MIKVPAKPKRRGVFTGRPPGLEEGHRAAARGPPDRDLRRGSGLVMAVKKYKPTSPGRRFMAVSSFEDDHQEGTREVAHRAAQEDRRPEQQRPHHDAPPGRRPQAPVPRDRLQAREGRRAGQGGRDRVRPQPVGPDRAAPLRRRRQGVHHRPAGPPRRRLASSRARRPTSRPATPCRSTTSRRARSSTTSS